LGKKLGAAFMIYGFLNLIGSAVLLLIIPFVGIAGFVWSMIFIGVGYWMRSNAKRNELLERMAKKMEEDRK
jgi:hypothetical protein